MNTSAKLRVYESPSEMVQRNAMTRNVCIRATGNRPICMTSRLRGTDSEGWDSTRRQIRLTKWHTETKAMKPPTQAHARVGYRLACAAARSRSSCGTAGTAGTAKIQKFDETDKTRTWNHCCRRMVSPKKNSRAVYILYTADVSPVGRFSQCRLLLSGIKMVTTINPCRAGTLWPFAARALQLLSGLGHV